MATISIVDRARIIMDLVKDGEVANLADYANVEKLAGPVALKYARAFWDAPGFAHPDVENPTNEQLAAHFINRMRQYAINLEAAVRVPNAVSAAQTSEAATVAAEGSTELGDDES